MPSEALKKIIRLSNNHDGIALVTSLMLTLISMGIIMSLMYMITSSVQRTGASKRYKSALAASYGGVEVIAKDLFPLILQNTGDPQLITTIQNQYPNSTDFSLSVATTQLCLQAKLTSQTSSWPSGCNTSLNAKNQPDITLSLPGTNNVPFTVYTKIVDTVAGNTDMGGLQLGGAGVAESQTVLSPQHFPYVFRLEVEAERSSNALEKADVSVLYAY